MPHHPDGGGFGSALYLVLDLLGDDIKLFFWSKAHILFFSQEPSRKRDEIAIVIIGGGIGRLNLTRVKDNGMNCVWSHSRHCSANLLGTTKLLVDRFVNNAIKSSFLNSLTDDLASGGIPIFIGGIHDARVFLLEQTNKIRSTNAVTIHCIFNNITNSLVCIYRAVFGISLKNVTKRLQEFRKLASGLSEFFCGFIVWKIVIKERLIGSADIKWVLQAHIDTHDALASATQNFGGFLSGFSLIKIVIVLKLLGKAFNAISQVWAFASVVDLGICLGIREIVSFAKVVFHIGTILAKYIEDVSCAVEQKILRLVIPDGRNLISKALCLFNVVACHGTGMILSGLANLWLWSHVDFFWLRDFSGHDPISLGGNYSRGNLLNISQGVSIFNSAILDVEL